MESARKLTRRSFLRFAGAAGGVAALAACVPATPQVTAPTKAPVETVAAEPTTVTKEVATVEPVTVEMWAPHPLDENIKIDDFVAQYFTPQHPDISLKFTRVPGDWEQKFRTAAAGKELPDIFAVDGINVPAYASRGLCAELDEVIPADVLDDYYPSARAEMQFRGKTYGVVLETNSQGVRVNVDLMKKAEVEPPKTWEELVEVGQKLTLDTNGKHPNEEGFDENALAQAAMETWCCLGEGSTWMIMPWIWMNGGEVIEEDTRKVRLTEELAIEAIQFLSDLIKKYKIWAKEGVLQAGPEGTWYGQLVVLSWTGAFNVAWLRSEPPAFEWDIAPIPVPSSTGKRISGVGGWLFSAWKESKNLKAALPFMEFMTSPEWQKHVSIYGYAIPGRRSIVEERLPEEPMLKVFLDAMLTGKARPRSTQYPLITDAFQQAIDSCIFGDRPVREALEEAAQKISDALALEEAE
mgnify:CR=1 FL=1